MWQKWSPWAATQFFWKAQPKQFSSGSTLAPPRKPKRKSNSPSNRTKAPALCRNHCCNIPVSLIEPASDQAAPLAEVSPPALAISAHQDGDLGMKIKFDEFFGFLRGRSPLPFFYGIDCCLYENRTAANHLSGSHLTVGRNCDFHLDRSSDLHFSC